MTGDVEMQKRVTELLSKAMKRKAAYEQTKAAVEKGE